MASPRKKTRQYKTRHVHLFPCSKCARKSVRRRRAVAEAMICAVCERGQVSENQLSLLATGTVEVVRVNGEKKAVVRFNQNVSGPMLAADGKENL